MVDPTTNLGREVPTPREVLEVIRPQLRFAALIGPAIDVGIQHEQGPLHNEPDPIRPQMILSGEDQWVSDSVFDALRENAAVSVKTWARDCGKVFDQAKMTAFIGAALNECFNGTPSNAVLDMLELDEGVCETLGLAIKGLASAAHDDERLTGVAACYFRQV
ncbi:MAG: hypothetical protein ACJ8DZ_13715 [Allosphingosinicella sp.]